MNVLFEDYKKRIESVIYQNWNDDGVDVDEMAQDFWLDIVEDVIDKMDDEQLKLEVKIEELEQEIEDIEMEIE
jgi:hypothetical protein